MINISLLARRVWGATHSLARPLAALGLLLATAGAAQAANPVLTIQGVGDGVR